MSLTLKTDPTLTSTVGTNVTYTRQKNQDGKSFYSVLDDSLLTRKKLTVKVTEPKVKSDSPDGHTQGRVELVFSDPITTAGGDPTYNTVRLELSRSVEATDAQINTLIDRVADSIISSGALNAALVENGQPE